ncbi:hypothetical protein GWC77_26240 [Paraburkholderia sp. NMBU_R16]|uniref:class I SAM-dependent methyltransferase n=1 Tax=Paraburkholderia sp. NMBU_R16 TaxID=2698676 RepID=UPI001565064A|nr:class I SAM-dependent methyltransferase [Paraburkholderia sp. NMBU_R16]NRO99387.1 hypothetical protein [Paraburkholderia sp. NMBU_R16]
MTAASPTRVNLSSLQLTRVYGQSYGWKMFDSRYLTDAVQAHLAQEIDALKALLTSFPHYRHLVEVGCGYGRLLEWSIGKGLSYDGLDLVSWMVQLGQVRSRRLLAQFPWARASVHCLPAEAIDTLFAPSSTCVPTVAVFPFNCLGNVVDVGDVLAAVARTPCDVVVSAFNTRPDTTAIRSEYYARCGFSGLESENRDEGILIRSTEGLHTFAYSDDYYRNVFDRFGFGLETSLDVSTHGHLLYFQNRETRRDGTSWATGSGVADATPFPRSTGRLTVRLSALMDGCVPGERQLCNQDDCLFAFDDQHVMACIEDDQLCVEIDHNWSPGTTVRIETTDPDSHEPTSRVAVVKHVRNKAPGRHLVTLWVLPSNSVHRVIV